MLYVTSQISLKKSWRIDLVHLTQDTEFAYKLFGPATPTLDPEQRVAILDQRTFGYEPNHQGVSVGYPVDDQSAKEKSKCVLYVVQE